MVKRSQTKTSEDTEGLTEGPVASTSGKTVVDRSAIQKEVKARKKAEAQALKDDNKRTIKKTYRFRVFGNTSCLEKAAKETNFVWNYLNETSFTALRNQSKWLSKDALYALTAGTSQELKFINAQSVQAICEEYATKRYKGKDPKTGKRKVKAKLRYRGKKKPGWAPFKNQTVEIKPLDKGGKGWRYYRFTLGDISVKFKCTRADFERVKRGAGDFSQDNKGNWYINISVSYVIDNPTHPAPGTSLGVDPNVSANKQYVDSNGAVYGHNLSAQKTKALNRINERVHHLEYSETVRGLIAKKKDLSALVYGDDSPATDDEKAAYKKEIASLKGQIGAAVKADNKKLSAQERHERDKTLRKERKKLGKIHYRFSAKGDEFVHTATNKILASAETIYFGDGLGGGLAKTTMARSYLAASPYRIFTTLSYKSIENGSIVQEVAEHYTTITCHVCLEQTDAVRGVENLGIRAWTCASCGTHHLRDHNSARNIEMKGQGLVTADFVNKKLVWELHTRGRAEGPLAQEALPL